MRRLDIAAWKNIFKNIGEVDAGTKKEFGDEVEVIWLDPGDSSGGEWALGYEYECFEDGFKTEEEARARLAEIERAI